MSVKAFIDKTKTYQKGETIIYKTNPISLKFDDIEKAQINQKDGKTADMYKVSFIEEVVWCTPDKPEEILTTMKNYICSYNNLDFNRMTLDKLVRGDEVNLILEFKNGLDKEKNPIWFQSINRIDKIDNGVHPTKPLSTQEIEVPLERPLEEKKVEVYTEKPDEDEKLPPIAKFKLSITHHDRIALSIQRQKSIEFALQYLQNKILSKDDSDTTYVDETGDIEKFIWDGIQSLWKDIPRTVENEENSKK